MPPRRFISPFNSVPVADPENKGRIARQIPKNSLPLLKTDLTYVLVPNARRKRISLALKPGKTLEVRIPKNYTNADLNASEAHIVENQSWILRVHEKYHRREAESSESLSETFPDRDYILFLGTKYPFQIQHSMTPCQTWVMLREGQYFEFKTDNEKPDDLCIALSDWYLKRAEEILPPIVEKYAASMKLPVPIMRYNRVKNGWASCYPTRNQLRFNILLMKLPPDCIEYIVVHELCHFYVPNHSKAFWDVVSVHMPDYQNRKKKITTYRTVL